MDEIELAIMGHIDQLRYDRRNAYLVHASLVKSPIDLFSALPLPYDFEISAISEDEIQRSVEWYNSVTSKWN